MLTLPGPLYTTRCDGAYPTRNATCVTSRPEAPFDEDDGRPPSLECRHAPVTPRANKAQVSSGTSTLSILL